MAKKLGTLLIVVGTACVIFALSLFIYNSYVDARAGKASAQLLQEFRSADRRSCDAGAGTIEIDGYAYIGYLSIPALDLELPVMDTWDYERLNVAPCRQFGAPETDDMVIAAHNFKNHFGNLCNLRSGDSVIFTDACANEYMYRVAEIDTLGATDVEAMQSSGYALALYTCTYSGQARTTVFCNRVG